jgi:pimeloyl-ACP methyl ester carboxylesterase
MRLNDFAMFDEFAQRAMALAATGGVDLGELVATAASVPPGDVDAWHDAWRGLAERVVAIGEASAAAGHAVSARAAFLRAAAYFRLSAQPLFGAPVDPRMAAASAREQETFARGAGQPAGHPLELVEIPYEQTTLPGALALVDDSGAARPTIVFVDGYDGTLQEMYFADGVAAVEHGYNALLFDGPGQGRNLVRDGMHLRPDWEHVVGPVLDWALTRPEVDPDRVVLAGWSLGGFLAPRAAAFHSSRLAALVADPGQWDMRAAVAMLPLDDEAKARFPDIDPRLLDPMEAAFASPGADPMMVWRLVKRGQWVHGVDSLYELFKAMMAFEISPVAGQITCPALLTQSEGDRLAAGVPLLFDAIGSERKALLRFAVAEGAGGHCEGLGRRVYHQRLYAWLDETLGA